MTDWLRNKNFLEASIFFVWFKLRNVSTFPNLKALRIWANFFHFILLIAFHLPPDESFSLGISTGARKISIMVSTFVWLKCFLKFPCCLRCNQFKFLGFVLIVLTFMKSFTVRDSSCNPNTLQRLSERKAQICKLFMANLLISAHQQSFF